MCYIKVNIRHVIDQFEYSIMLNPRIRSTSLRLKFTFEPRTREIQLERETT